jgi:hypothetical protein
MKEIEDMFRAKFEPFIDGLINELPANAQQIDNSELARKKMKKWDEICLEIANEIDFNQEQYINLANFHLKGIHKIKAETAKLYEEMDKKLQAAINQLA